MTEAPSRGRLLQVLGVAFGLAVTIGNGVAAGIVRTPGDIVTYLPTTGLFIAVWLAGGLYALLGSISIAELGTMLPCSGGQYVFARRAFGSYAGFVLGWSDWISTCGSTAAVAIVVGEYSSALLAPYVAWRGKQFELSIAAAVVVGFMLVNWRGIRRGSVTQNLTSLLKALVYAGLIAAAFLYAGPHPARTESAVAAPSGMGLYFAFILALQAVMYTYDGWTGPIYFSEEVRQPGRDIPRAMIGGALSMIAIYALFNLALLHIVPFAKIAGNNFAMGAIAETLFGPAGDTLARALMVLCMLSAINAYVLMNSRVLFAMSRDGLFSRRATAVNPGGTPTMALFLSTVVAIAFLISGRFEKVIAVCAFFFVANYAVSFAAIFLLRWREPELPRPYRAWGYPWTTGLSLLGSVAFLVGAILSDPQTSRVALAVLALSYPAFRLMKLPRTS